MKNLKKLIAPVIGVTTVASIAVVGAIVFNSSGINKVSADSNKLDSSIVSTAIQYCGHTSDNTDEHIKVKNDHGGYDDVGSAAITQHLNFRYEIYDNEKNPYGGNTLRIWFGRNSESNVYNERNAIIDGLEDVKFKLYSIDDPYHIIVNYSDILGQVFDVRNPLYIDLNSENTSHGNNKVPQSIKFKFSLESDSFGCVSQTKFNEYTAALATDNANGNTNAQDDFFNKYPTIDRNKKLYTYGIGSADSNDGYEIVIPNLLAGGSKKVENPQYYTMCKALRGEGNDDGNGGNYIDTAVYKNHKAENVGDYLEFFKYCNQKEVSATLDDADVKKLIESAITFVNLMNTESSAGNYSTDYFNFEQVRKEAIQKGNGYKIDNNGKWLSISNCFDGNGNFNIDLCTIGSEEKNEFSLKCKYVAKDTYSTNRKAGSFVDSFDQLRPTDSNGNYNLKANTEHYYAYSVEDVPGQQYLYHYTGTGNITYTDSKNNTIFTRDTGTGIEVGKESSGSCKKTCEETVEVNYGPPIASSAGLCFEYEVEVISKVRCSTSTKDIKPPTEKQMCNPIPICNNIPGYIHQAGPLEDYENCIDSCDGGKYTKSCSEKCYNKVYGKSSNASKTASKEYGNNILRKVAYAETGASRYEHAGRNGNTLSFKGYYTRKKVNGIYHIYWVSTSNILSNTYSRYYRDDPNEYAKLWNDDRNSGGIRDSVGALYFPDNGFKRADYWGSTCGDYCYFSGCTRDDLYLNQDELNADAKRNYEIYESVIASCKAAASCESKTASFKISVDYTTVKSETVTTKTEQKCVRNETKTVDFPITDLTTSSSEDENSCSGNSYSDIVNNDKSVILDYKGCYKDCGKGSWYYTKWSFPGTWVYPKKGKISWEDKGGTPGWKYESDKFCLPLNIANTNEEYWKYYQAHLTEADVPSYKDGNPYAETHYKLSDLFDPFDSSNSTRGEANLRASTSNFGKFGWNVNVSCFYAVYDETTTETDEKGNLISEECDNESRYRIRTVELTDLFPSKDGTESTDPSKYSTDIDDVPFNWTDKAASSKVQIPGVAADPESYGKYVQTKGYDIYTDAELEYQFHLTPSIMKEFKHDSTCMNSSDYFENTISSSAGEGSTSINASVLAYKSKCIRDGGKLVTSVKKIPNSGLLGCNNINNGKCVTAFSSLS